MSNYRNIILDAKGKPIPAAVVQALSPIDGSLLESATADINGAYQFDRANLLQLFDIKHNGVFYSKQEEGLVVLPNVFYISKNGESNGDGSLYRPFDKFADAYAAAAADDFLYVLPGYYIEDWTINTKHIKIYGMGATLEGKITIDGAYNLETHYLNYYQQTGQSKKPCIHNDDGTSNIKIYNSLMHAYIIEIDPTITTDLKIYDSRIFSTEHFTVLRNNTTFLMKNCYWKMKNTLAPDGNP